MKPRVNPSGIMQLTTAYWGSMALFAGNQLGIFTALAGREQTPEDLARQLGVVERPLRLLLQALAALGLLSHREGRYANSEAAEAFLVEGRPAYLGQAIRYGADHYALWATLPEVIRSGAAVSAATSYLGADPERTRHFVHGMHARAIGVARSVVECIELPADTLLLDVGGGPGTYSLLLAQKTPGLRAIVFDLPPIVAIAEEIIGSFGLAGRVTVRAGDFIADPYPTNVGAVLLSGVLHREPEATCRSMLGKAWAALVPDGRVIVSDVMLDDDRVSPPFATLFALHMLVSSERGGAHAKGDHAQWLRQAGFTEVKIHALPPPAVHTVITATKPR
jgi:3-hydroxy-5-methyl-1-naphthoate 3-O-methyltransferase